MALCGLLRLVACQFDVMDAGDPFKMIQDSLELHSDVVATTKGSEPGATAASTMKEANGASSKGPVTVLDYGSQCFRDDQCNALLGLACISNDNHALFCACAPSTPVYVNEGGIQKCVRAKNLYEACVTNQECSFGNPNVQCINFLCNCTHPFELTPTRHCLLPAGQGGSVFTVALTVMLALALLLLAGGYAYQKMVRERDSGSSSSGSRSSKRRCGRRNTETSSTSSTARILGKERPWPDVEDDRGVETDSGEGEELGGDADEPQHSHDVYRDPSPPRHPPRYINQQVAKNRKVTGLPTVQECCSRAERSSSDSDHGAEAGGSCESGERRVVTTPLPRTRKGRHLPDFRERKTRAEMEYNIELSGSSPMHLLRPKDEQMQRILDKQQVVVTIETHKGRRASLGTAPSPPPVISLRRREVPPSESTDDSFMKDLKRRRSLKARRTDDLGATTSTRQSASAEPLRVSATAVQCALPTPAGAPAPVPASAPAPAVANKAQLAAEPPATGAMVGISVPVHVFSASTKLVKKPNVDVQKREDVPSQSAEKPGTADKNSQASGEADSVRGEPPLRSKIDNERPSIEHDKNSSKAEAPSAKRRRASSPAVLTASSYDREQNLKKMTDVSPLLPAAQTEGTKISTVQQSKFPVEMISNGAVFQQKTKDLPVPPATQVLPQATKQQLENFKSSDSSAPAKVLKDAMVGASSSAVTDSKITDPEPKQEDKHTKVDEVKLHHKSSDQLKIEEVGELARLLSGLIKKHGKMACGKMVSDHAASNKGRRLRKQGRGGKDVCLADGAASEGSRLPQKQRTEETSDEPTEVKLGGIEQGPAAKKPSAPPAEVEGSLADLSEQQISTEHSTKQATTTMEDALNTTAATKPPELPPTPPSVKEPPKERQNTDQQSFWPSRKQIAHSSFSRVKSQEITLREERSMPLTAIENSADDEKYGSDRIGGKIPQPIPLSVPQDHRGWVPIGAAYAAQRTPERQTVGTQPPTGNTSEARDISLTFSDVGGVRSNLPKQPSVSSVVSETTPSLTVQKPYQEYMVKQLQPPVHFAERPFADILASLESDMTSILKDDDKDGVKNGKAVNKSLQDSAAQSSTQSGMNDESLDEAGISTSSREQSDSRSVVVSSGGAETSGSGKSSAPAPTGRITVSSKGMTATTSVDSNEASREVPRALLTFCDSDEGSVQPSESMSLSFLSSNSSCNALHRLTDLVDLPRLERSVVAATHETGDGVVLGMPPRVTSPSAVQTENSWQPTLSRSERGAQAHLLPERPPPGRAGLPLLRKTRRRDTTALVATDRPWTEDVKKVVMLGNKHYLRQHAARYPVAKSATTFDETQYLLLQIDDQAQQEQAQPVEGAASRTFLEAPCSMSLSRELTRESCESTLEALLRRSTGSSLKDIGTPRSEDNFEPLKLSELILLQHPAVGLKNFAAVDFAMASGLPPLRAGAAAPSAEGAAEHIGGVQEIQPGIKEVSDLKTGQKAEADADEPAFEKTRQKSAAGLCPEPFLVTAAAPNGTGVKFSEVHRRPQRPSLTRSAAKVGGPEYPSERERAVSKKATGAAATRTAEPTVRFAGPPSSQAVVFSDHSVAIRLPGGAIRSVLPAQACGITMPEGGAASRAVPTNRQLLLARTLEEPSFESIYNAILQPPAVPQAVALDTSAPGDVPCSSARATSSSRAVSFDDSLTVVPLEPPPESFAKYDTSETTDVDSPAPSPLAWRQLRARRRSSLCRSLSGSRLHATESTESCAARKMKRRSSPRRLPSVPTTAAGASPVPRGSGASRRDMLSPLMSPFYSFEDTGSELSFPADSNNFGWSASGPNSQRSDEERRGQAQGQASGKRPA